MDALYPPRGSVWATSLDISTATPLDVHLICAIVGEGTLLQVDVHSESFVACVRVKDGAFSGLRLWAPHVVTPSIVSNIARLWETQPLGCPMAPKKCRLRPVHSLPLNSPACIYASKNSEAFRVISAVLF